MRRINFIYLYWLLLILLVSCKKNDEVSFDQPLKRYDLIVEGGINTLRQGQFIRLSKPSLSPDSLPAPIRKAIITVNDGNANLVFSETNVAGVYSANNFNPPNYNKGYTLTIKYNNQTYTAVDTLRQMVNINDDFLPLSVTKNADGTYSGTIPKHTFGYLNPNKWWISYDKIPLWDARNFEQNQYYSYTHFLGSPNSLYPLNNLKRTFTLNADDPIFIYKMSLSEAYAKYLYGIFLETDWNGLFSGVPENVKSNISGNTLGYFSVSDMEVRRYRVRELRQ